MSQLKKTALTPGIKAVLKKYGVKARLSVNNHSTLVLNIQQSKIDFLNNFKMPERFNADKSTAVVPNHISVNPYWFQDNFTNTSLNFLTEVFAAMNSGNHDSSDMMSDYFCVGWYADINIGKWNQPYILEE